MEKPKQEKNWGKIAANFDEFSEYVVGKDINNKIFQKLSKENKMGKPPKADKGNLTPEYLETYVKNAGFKVEENILLGNNIKALYFKGVKK